MLTPATTQDGTQQQLQLWHLHTCCHDVCLADSEVSETTGLLTPFTACSFSFGICPGKWGMREI
jgi:hypothetical protein